MLDTMKEQYGMLILLTIGSMITAMKIYVFIQITISFTVFHRRRYRAMKEKLRRGFAFLLQFRRSDG